MAVKQHAPIRKSRRGVVSDSECDKPIITAEELLTNRRRGMSYASIGKKLGIDTSKEEVLNVFKAIMEDETFPDIEDEIAILNWT